MPDSQTQQALRAALQFVMTSDIPSQHKVVVVEALTQALRDLDAAAVQHQEAQQVSAQWQTHEIAKLHSLLDGKVANSWQQADELVMLLAAQLHRPAQDIRAKAIELGAGVAVDFQLAKARIQAERE